MKWKEGNFLKIAVVILILLNVGLMANQWMGHKSSKRGGKNPPAMLVEEVGFNAEQKREFDDLRKKHGDRNRELKREIADLRKKFFGLLKNENTEEYKNIKLRLGKLQEQEMEALYIHFKEVRAICNTEEQKEQFDIIIGRSIPRQNERPPRHFEGHGPPNRPPPPR